MSIELFYYPNTYPLFRDEDIADEYEYFERAYKDCEKNALDNLYLLYRYTRILMIYKQKVLGNNSVVTEIDQKISQLISNYFVFAQHHFDQSELRQELRLHITKLFCKFALDKQDIPLFSSMLQYLQQHSSNNPKFVKFKVDYYIFLHYQKLSLKQFDAAIEAINQAKDLARNGNLIGELTTIYYHRVRIKLAVFWDKVNNSQYFSPKWIREFQQIYEEFWIKIYDGRRDDIEKSSGANDLIKLRFIKEMRLLVQLKITKLILKAQAVDINSVYSKTFTYIKKLIANIQIPKATQSEIVVALERYYAGLSDEVAFTIMLDPKIRPPLMELQRLIYLPDESRKAFEQIILSPAEQLTPFYQEKVARGSTENLVPLAAVQNTEDSRNHISSNQVLCN